VAERGGRLWPRLVPYALVLLVAAVCAAVIGWGFRVFRLDIHYLHPDARLLLLGAALAAWVGFHLHVQRAATFSFSRVGDLQRTRRGLLSRLAPLPRAMRVVALGLLVFALAGPQTKVREEVNVEGIDIMIVLDMSKSMEEKDIRPNRILAAQRTIINFLGGRKNDKIGLVVFAKQALMQCPLTVDYDAVRAIVSDLRIGDIDPMGTAIGDGVGLAIAALRRSEAKSKVVILLTDGESNVINQMNPEESIASARDRKIRVFTVLMGRELAGGAPPPIDAWGRQEYGTNPALLERFAAETDGKYFHAGDAEALDHGFEEVRATLEKSKWRETRVRRREYYDRFVFPALALVLFEVLLSLTRFRKFP
jgi:Ca-activated chloride channel homolog